MKKYYANMSVNNGTHYRPDWEGTNKKKLAKKISASARANCFAGSEYSWTCWDEDGTIVAAGSGYKKYNGNFIYYGNRKGWIGQSINYL